MSKEAQASSHDMAQYRERLISQKEFLANILSKIEEQILALQVERLHLRNTMLGTGSSRQEISSNASTRDNCLKTEPLTNDKKNPIEQELDLSLALHLNNNEEEMDDDDQLEFLT